MPYSVAKPKMLLLQADPGPRMAYSLKQTRPKMLPEANLGPRMPYSLKQMPPASSSRSQDRWIKKTCIMTVELVTFAEDITWNAPKDSAFLMVDANDLYDTIGDLDHTGAHTWNLNAVLENKAIPWHFLRIKMWVQEQVTSTKTQIYLGMSCNAGTHSSVSLATLVQHCLIVAEGCQVNLVHTAASTRFKCAGKQALGGACHECTGHDTCSPAMKTLRADCFSMAVQLWQNVEHVCPVHKF